MAGCPNFCSQLALLIFFSSLCYVSSLDLSCIGVKEEYNKKMGLRDDNVPISPISGNNLQVCTQESTCCTPDMENKLMSLSGKEFESVVDNTFKLIKNTFVSRTKKFDDFFIELLTKAEEDLNVMFVQTYGQIYKQNAKMFTELFEDLRHYYKGSNVNLVDILNDFFTDLLKRMFTLMNAQYLFDDDYMSCVTKHMDKLNPFGDVPQKLKRQVKRAFIAARTFVQGLAIGRDVILAMERVKPTDECRRGLTKMMYCPYCQGLMRTKPCNNYCLNTMKGCLAQHSELNKAWNEYIEALKLVAQRLEGPFNIETVVDPIDVKISEAIMNFQEHGATVSDNIFKGCGTPRRNPSDSSSRFKRQSGESGTDYYSGADFMNFGNRRHETSNEKPATAGGTNLDRLVQDIKDKTEQAKNFWIQLPYLICNGEVAATQGQDDDCWNGKDRSRYVHMVQKDGRIYQANNPEVTVDVQEDNGIVSVQIYNLKLITTKLHHAYNGIDVEWTPTTQIQGGNLTDVASGDRRKETVVVEGSGKDSTRVDEDPEEPTSSGDRIVEGSGSGSGDKDPDEETSQPVRPSGRPNPTVVGRTDRPVMPPYDVTNKPEDTKKDKGSGASTPASSSAFMLLSAGLVVIVQACLLR